MEPRIIPVLLVQDGGVVKTERFRKPRYIGDLLNTIRIFNDLEVDELCILDIEATRSGRGPDLALLKEAAQEAFMPISYGGGIRSLDDARSVLGAGTEKVVLGAGGLDVPNLVSEISNHFGAQSVVACIDHATKRGRRVFDHRRRKIQKVDPIEWAVQAVRQGAGEILFQDADRDGTMAGFDLDFVRDASQAIRAPVVVCGGAASASDLEAAIQAGADAVAAGALFVYRGARRGILVNYPDAEETARIRSLRPMKRPASFDQSANAASN